jgi:molecular chaperone GrpE
LKDKYLRLYAEFENYKKRTIRERLEMAKTAAQDTMTALLPVLDDFDRAKKASEDPQTDESFSEGVNAVYHKLYQALERKGLKAMDSTGEPFDAEIHEAIQEFPAPSEDLKGKVIDTVEKGYWLNDRIIRHAKVVVGK